MAEPRTSLHTWKRSIILLVVVLVNIPVRLYAVKIRRPESGYTAASNQPKSVGAGIVSLVVDSHGDGDAK
jgi:hypothetical protein